MRVSKFGIGYWKSNIERGMRNEMSVGTSSDIRKVSVLCRDVYRKCREAGAEYEEIRREVKGLYGVVRELKEEEEERNGEWDEGNWVRVEEIIGDCEGTLRQLDGLLARYGRNGGGRLGSNEMDQLGGIRVKLISHKKNISHFLDSLLHEDEDGDTKEAEDEDGKGELDMLLDKVDDIAADRSRRVGTLQMMGSENEDEEDNLQIWKWFRRNLVEEGVNRVVLERHKVFGYFSVVGQLLLTNRLLGCSNCIYTTNGTRWSTNRKSICTYTSNQSKNSSSRTMELYTFRFTSYTSSTSFIR